MAEISDDQVRYSNVLADHSAVKIIELTKENLTLKASLQIANEDVAALQNFLVQVDKQMGLLKQNLEDSRKEVESLKPKPPFES
jgi:archaellum component FlaC